ncbi:hypothetical protein D910_05811 [Dendroctonus ponderosae]
MRRNSHDMQVNVAGIRRNIKNFAHNYSDAQKKVREATSNDPWGPSSTIMAEIADLTYNVVAFSEIMQMVWKRLNDHGKNWRHVYKALVVLEYLIKTGSEKVGQQCKENIYAIQTLKDFQHLEEAELPRDIEIARPQTAGEEELQLQLALAMSREEAEQEEQKRKSDDVRLQLALSQSQQDFKKSTEKIPQSHLVDLLDVNLGGDPTPVDPWGMPQPPRPQQSSPWQSSALSSPARNHPAPVADPWQPSAAQPIRPKPDPWGLQGGASAPPSNLSPVNTGSELVRRDPWSPTSPGSSTDLDEFDIITNRNRPTSPKTNGNIPTTNDPFELNLLGDVLAPSGSSPSMGATKKTPQSFLGENSALVNLDNLVTTSKPNNPALVANPFSDPTVPQPAARPVFNTQPPKPTINEIKQQSFAQFGGQPQPIGTAFGAAASGAQADPWTPVPSNSTLNGNGNVGAPWMKPSEPANPFLS